MHLLLGITQLEKKNIKTLNIIRPVQILDLNFVSKNKLSAVLQLQGTS